MYVDDCLIFAPNADEAEKTFQAIKSRFEITDDTSESGTIEAYLGIKVEHHQDGSFMMSQPHLIRRIIDAIPGMSKANSVNTPFASSTLLDKDENGAPRE